MKLFIGSRVQITGGADYPYITGTVTEIHTQGERIALVSIDADRDEFKGMGPWWVADTDILEDAP